MQINPRYMQQLQAVLTWPQSVGIVGGRPSSSLYFIGFQGQHVLYLDPHEVQEVCSCGHSTQ
jgi:cysteine protease ATG4